MPRIRTIKPEFWSHPVMGRQDDHIKTLAIALLNYADDEGYFYADPSAIRSFARPYELQEDYWKVPVSLQRLIEIEFIEVRQHEKRGFIGKVLNFLEHQVISHAKPSKINHFFDESISLINPVTFHEPSSNVPSGKERKGREEYIYRPNGNFGHNGHSPATQGEIENDPVREKESEIVEAVFRHYCISTERNSAVYRLTPARRKIGLARLRDCLKCTKGDYDKAAELMRLAVDNMAKSNWHMGRDPNSNGKKYCDFVDHLFKSYERMDKWWQEQ